MRNRPSSHFTADRRFWWSGSQWVPAFSPDASQRWTGTRWVPNHPHRRRGLLWGVLGLGAATIVVAADGLAGLVYFEPTQDVQFHSWVTGPFRMAGELSVVLVGAALFCWALERRWPWLFVLSVGLLALTLGVLTWGVIGHYERGHPEAQMRAELAGISLPAREFSGGHSILFSNGGAPAGDFYPVARRTWIVRGSARGACRSVQTALRGWSGPPPTLTWSEKLGCDVETGDTFFYLSGVISPTSHPPNMVLTIYPREHGPASG